jgi:glycine/D-amino acid oxidase-like deaminating enzyme
MSAAAWLCSGGRGELLGTLLTEGQIIAAWRCAGGRGRAAGRVARARVSVLERHGDLFRVQFDDRTVTARRVLVATGARDQLPDIGPSTRGVCLL